MYRIGDFAKELGVTPDFLKYCEKNGFLQPHVEENGYRYFDFPQSGRTIEYLKMKNQGYTAKEIKEAIHDSSFDLILRQTEQKGKELRQKIYFYEELLRYYDYLKEIRGNFGKKPVWYVRQAGGFYFLPHTKGSEFISDEATHERIRDWNQWLPIVMSTNKFVLDAEGVLSERFDNCWGFSVPEDFARTQGMQLDSPVEYVKPGRFLEIFMTQSLSPWKKEAITYTRELLGQNHLRQSGCAYSKIIAKIWEEGVRTEYSILYIPVEN